MVDCFSARYTGCRFICAERIQEALLSFQKTCVLKEPEHSSRGHRELGRAQSAMDNAGYTDIQSNVNYAAPKQVLALMARSAHERGMHE